MRKLLAGRYQLDKRLGAGGQGRVYRGRDLVTGATVAVKLLDEGSSPEAVSRFQLEGRLGARIRDPHLVAVLHAGVSEGQHYIVFDYIPRVVPLTVMCDHGRADAARVCDVALQVLDALATLHDAKVTHQDVSPANCLYRERDTGRLEVFLVDLGSAATRSPITGVPVPPRPPAGTTDYTAPEMLDGGHWDHRVDLWSVGAVMYRLLTAREVDLGTPDEPLGIPAPAVLVPSIPQAVSDVVMRALAVPDQRYPSATAMAEDIRRALPDRHHRPARVGIPDRATLGVAALVAVVAIVATITAQRALGTPSSTATAPHATVEDRREPLPSAPPSEAPTVVADAPAPVVDVPSTDPALAAVKPESPRPAPVVDVPSTDPALAAVKPESPRPPTGATISSKVKRPTWDMVSRAVKRKARDLAPCSEDEFISLGLKVSEGRALLETVDGKPVSSRDHCIRDVVARLRFPSGGELGGVVGVPLPSD